MEQFRSSSERDERKEEGRKETRPRRRMRKREKVKMGQSIHDG